MMLLNRTDWYGSKRNPKNSTDDTEEPNHALARTLLLICEANSQLSEAGIEAETHYQNVVRDSTIDLSRKRATFISSHPYPLSYVNVLLSASNKSP